MPTNLEAYWMPFTANRQFKANPRLLAAAKDMHYFTPDGRPILDGTAGLWCVNAGHCRPKIVEAIQKQVAHLDYAPPFQMGHPGAFELAERLVKMMPGGHFDHVFYGNSGSEAVETALKIAIAYHRVRGEGARQRLIGRERGYHGVGFGGISVGGIAPNRKFFGSLIPGVDHLPHTHNLEHNAFTRGQPKWGEHLADELERIVTLHDPSTIAAVIVEPVAGSTGVLIPPVGYLERLRAICDKYGILLIFDEVITGFGRLGASFATEYFGVIPDMVTVAKGITNGTVPMGAVFTRKGIYDAFMEAAAENAIEFFHGYTYSGHPLACAAAMATLDVYEEEGLFANANHLASYWEECVHSLRGLPHVIDVRNLGLVAAIELEPIPGKPSVRAMDCLQRCYETGLLIRTTGDIIALSPPLMIQKDHIAQMFEMLAGVLRGSQVSSPSAEANSSQAIAQPSSTGEVSTVDEAIKTLVGTLCEMLRRLTRKAGVLLNADRTSIFLLDQQTQQLGSLIAEDGCGGYLQIDIPANRGIVSLAASSSEVINIPFDVYDSPISEEAKNTDQKTGYRTYTILAWPVFNDRKDLVAVVELINKLKPNYDPQDELSKRIDPKGFTQEDEAVFAKFAPSILRILEKCQMCYQLAQKLRKNEVITQGGVVLQEDELIAELLRQEQHLRKSLEKI